MSALKRVESFAMCNGFSCTLADLRAVVALAKRATSPSLANDPWQHDVRELRELKRRIRLARRLVTSANGDDLQRGLRALDLRKPLKRGRR